MSDSNNIMKDNHLYNIDFLRFLFAVFIVYYHLVIFLHKQFPHISIYDRLRLDSAAIGSNIVLAFFILSGYFLCQSSLNKKSNLILHLKNRVIRLWPPLLLSYVPILLLGIFNIYDLLNVFFISNGLGIVKSPSHNAATWFVCVLFWLDMLFYFLLLRYGNKIVPILVIFSFLSFVWLTNSANGGLYSAIALPSLQLTTGMIRGLGGISIGIIICYKINLIKVEHHKYLLSISEIALLLLICHYLCNHRVITNEIFYQLMIVALLICFFLNKGIISKLLNKKICKVLGGYSYGIYVIHFPIIELMRRFWWENNLISSPVIMIVVSIILCIGIGGNVVETV